MPNEYTEDDIERIDGGVSRAFDEPEKYSVVGIPRHGGGRFYDEDEEDTVPEVETQ